MIDVEKTTQVTPRRVDLSKGFDPDALMGELASRISEKVRAAYPIQGRLIRGADGPETDMGGLVGVAEGMGFAVLRKADANSVIPGATARVTGAPGPSRAVVSLEGMTADRIPDEGLFVLETTGAPPAS